MSAVRHVEHVVEASEQRIALIKYTVLEHAGEFLGKHVFMDAVVMI